MTYLLEQYGQKLRQSFVERDAGRIDREDDLLADLDKIWLSMTPAERDRSKQIALRIDAHHSALAGSELSRFIVSKPAYSEELGASQIRSRPPKFKIFGAMSNTAFPTKSVTRRSHALGSLEFA